MSSYTTLQISRTAAIKAILKSMGVDMSTAALEEALDVLLENQLLKCDIVTEDDGPDDDQVGRSI